MRVCMCMEAAYVCIACMCRAWGRMHAVWSRGGVAGTGYAVPCHTRIAVLCHAVLCHVAWCGAMPTLLCSATRCVLCRATQHAVVPALLCSAKWHARCPVLQCPPCQAVPCSAHRAVQHSAHPDTQVSVPHCVRGLPLGGKGKRHSTGQVWHARVADVPGCWAEQWVPAPGGTPWHPVTPQKVRGAPRNPLACHLAHSATVVLL